jgi:hypothetical protein
MEKWEKGPRSYLERWEATRECLHEILLRAERPWHRRAANPAAAVLPHLLGELSHRDRSDLTQRFYEVREAA